jgi:hypothetical protein
MRQVLPAAPGDEDIENAFNGATVVSARSTRASREREKWTDEGPLAIGEMNPAYGGMLLSVSKLPVVYGCNDSMLVVSDLQQLLYLAHGLRGTSMQPLVGGSIKWFSVTPLCG